MTAPANFPKDRISLCMIVKDEAERLGRCLASAAPWVGEMVVVDTGSTDDTVAIAESFGAKIVDFPWSDDFAAARNASLEAASRPWALVLDADEELVVDDPAAFAAAMSEGRCTAFQVAVRNLAEDGHDTTADVLRLFDRSRPGMRYRGELHEHLGAVADRAAEVGFLPAIRIRHEGYLPEVMRTKDKAARNERLARKAVAARPADAQAWYALADSLPIARWPERSEAFGRVLALAADRPELADVDYVVHAHARLAWDALVAGDLAAALVAAERGLAAFPDYQDLRLVRAKVRTARGDQAGARADYLACLEPPARRLPPVMPPDELVRVAREGLVAHGAKIADAAGGAPAGFPKDRISLCMIVKDEAERLGRCLASAAPWVGEMIVVDTGSTDDTVAIAEATGAKVVRFAWVDDFAAARNASLEAATRPWALVLDGDEELVIEDPAAFAVAVTQDRYAGFTFFQLNLGDDGLETRAAVFRLFDRSRPGMRYRGHVHEQVEAVADGQYLTAKLPGVAIRHEGYLAQVVAAKAKPERNVRLARKLVQDRPDDPHAWYVLGLSLAQDEAAERRSAFERAIDAHEANAPGKREAYVAHAFVNLVRDAGRAGDQAYALAVAERGLATFPTAPDLLLVRASARLAAQDLAGAAADFRACLTNAASDFPVSEINVDEVARVARGGLRVVGRLALAAGDVPGAFTALADAGPDAPADLEKLEAWFVAALEGGRFEAIEAAILHAPALGPARWPAVRKRWAAALAHAGFLDVALHLLLAAREETPEDPDLYYWIGFCALEGGQPEDALVMWQTCVQLAPDHPLGKPALAMLAGSAAP